MIRFIGVGGAGLLGVDNSVQAARRHSAEVKSLVLLSGETFLPDLQFLRQASQLPGLFVVDDDDEYPPTVEAMELLYITSSNPGKKFVHYSAAEDAPWIWYETHDIGRVAATGRHGTDMFNVHPELPGIIVDWFVFRRAAKSSFSFSGATSLRPGGVSFMAAAFTPR